MQRYASITEFDHVARGAQSQQLKSHWASPLSFLKDQQASSEIWLRYRGGFERPAPSQQLVTGTLEMLEGRCSQRPNARQE